MKKKPIVLQKSPGASQKLWGININDTKIEGVIVDDSRPAEPLFFSCLEIASFSAYDRLRGYEYILEQIELLIEQLERASNMPRPEKIGIAVPGAIDPSTGIITYCNILCFNDRSLREDLSAVLKIEPILDNDANCFTLAEVMLGAAYEKDVAMGLILETGVGSGIVIGERIIQGLHGVAGEWGHNVMQGEETLCCCGKRGCNEMVFSKPALERFYEEVTGEEILFQEILCRADNRELVALQTLKRFQDKFAEAISVIINLLDPEVIVIGGALRAIKFFYEEETRFKISKHVLNKNLKTRILPSALGEKAIIIGAAILGA